MAVLIEKKALSHDFFLLTIKQDNTARMGQFYMVRGWDRYPLLSRPISVYDSTPQTVSLLCKNVGEGTDLLSKLKAGDAITLDGPYGNGFPAPDGNIALVGGGVGIAPLYLAAKTLRSLNPNRKIDIYLGFSDKALLRDEFTAVCDNLTVNVGGYITDEITPSAYDHILTCGPDIMMRILHQKCAESDTPLYVSLENHMACGLGVCLVCSCKTVDGNRKVCKDGPVFLSKAVYFDA